MKKFLAVLMLSFSAAASAANHEIAVMENDAGDRIVLTQRECPIPDSAGFRLSYYWTPGIHIFGCWKLQSNSRTVDVLWITPDGESHYRTYSTDNFKLIETI